MNSRSVLAAALGLSLVAMSLTSGAAFAQMSSGAPRDTARAGNRYIHLIRHGWYDGADPRDDRAGKGLDSLGRAQAKLTGDRLAHLLTCPR